MGVFFPLSTLQLSVGLGIVAALVGAVLLYSYAKDRRDWHRHVSPRKSAS